MPKLLVDDALLDRIADAVCGATSLDQTQPWIRLTEPDVIQLHADVGREQWLADRSGRACYLSVGAALFSVRLAIRCTGLDPVVRLLPDRGCPPTVVAAIHVTTGDPATPAERGLFAALDQRTLDQRTLDQRTLDQRTRIRGLSQPDLVLLEQAAGAEHATLRLLSRPTADSLRARIGAAQCGPRPALAVITTAGDGPVSWLQAGQALQHVLLTAAGCGLPAAPLYPPIEVPDVLTEVGRWPGPERPQVLVEFGVGAGRPATSPATVRAVPAAS